MDTTIKFDKLVADTAKGFSPFYGACGHTLKQQRSRRQALDIKPGACFWPLPLNGSVAANRSYFKKWDW